MKRSKAIPFGGSWGCILFNSDDTAIQKDIVNAIENIRDPHTGELVVEKIYRSEDFYCKDTNNYLPDLLLKPKPDYRFTIKYEDEIFNDLNSLKYPYRGDHDLEGMVIFTGAHILKRSKRIWANIWDIAPSLLYFMDLPIPSIMDGKVLKDIFNKEFAAKESPKYVDSFAGSQPKSSTNVYKAADEKKVEERLKDLGYL